MKGTDPRDARNATGVFSPQERFWAKVQGDDVSVCWLWTASHDRRGYGQFMLTTGRLVRAHRFAYQDMVGEIPVGLQLDHLCHTPLCVNPWHLEPVTNRVNSRRGDRCRATDTECANGHPWNEESIYYDPQGGLNCRVCTREKMRGYALAARRAAAA